MSNFTNDYINYVQPGTKIIYREISSAYIIIEDYDNGDRIVTRKNFVTLESPRGIVKSWRPITDEEKRKLENEIRQQMVSM